MTTQPYKEAKKELDSLRSVVKSLDEPEIREYAGELAEQTDDLFERAERALESDEPEKTMELSAKVRGTAEKVLNEARKREKLIRAARKLKKEVTEATHPLKEIEGDDATRYAPELVEDAETILKYMDMGLRARKFRKVIDTSPELRRLGGELKGISRSFPEEVPGEVLEPEKELEGKLKSLIEAVPEEGVEKGPKTALKEEVPGKPLWPELEEDPTEVLNELRLEIREALSDFRAREKERDACMAEIMDRLNKLDELEDKFKELEESYPGIFPFYQDALDSAEDVRDRLSDIVSESISDEGESALQVFEESVDSLIARVPKTIRLGEEEELERGPKSYLELQRIFEPGKDWDELRRKSEEFDLEVKKAKVPDVLAYDPITQGPLAKFEGLEGFKEIERYWVDEPFAFAVILRNELTSEFRYHLVEPELSEREERILAEAKETLRDTLPYEGIEGVNKEDILKEIFKEIVEALGITDLETIYKLFYIIKRDDLGLGKIDPLLKDENLEDISCDGVGVPVFLYHRKYYNIETNLNFGGEIDFFVSQLAERSGKHISYGSPIIESTLPDGTRVQATLGTEVTTRGSSFSIRKFIGSTFTPVDLIRYGTFNPEMLAYLWLAAENGRSTMIVGGTASGKTSTLNALAFFIPPDAKIVSIEDTRELSLYQENWLPNLVRESVGAETKDIDMHELVKVAMRQRPECLIVGEVRGIEARAMFQAISTGHTAFSTLHAGSVQRAANRLQGEPIKISKSMLAGLDIVCVQLLTSKGRERVRRNMKIVEIVGIEPSSGDIRIVETFHWNKADDSFIRTERSHVLEEIRRELGISAKEQEEELKRRERLLRYIAEESITSYGDIASIIHQYYFDPEGVLEKIS